MKNALLIVTTLAILGLGASVAEAHWNVNLGFMFPARPVVYQAPVVYAPPPPVYNYYSEPVYYAQPPYPCTVTPVGYDEVQVVYYVDGFRRCEYYPRERWEHEGWNAHRHGHRW